MVKININYLSCKRYDFIELTVNTLKKVKEENKKHIHFTIAAENHININVLNKYKKELEQSNIKCSVNTFHNGLNYMDKINHSVNYNSEYTFKFDEDIFINNYLWDYLIENVDILNDQENLLLAPLLSNGIPTVDLFVEDYFNENDKNIIKNSFKNSPMPSNCWGCNYDSLNNYTVNSKEWNSDDFYVGVNNINHHYKGVHPVRLNTDSNFLVNDLIWKDLNKVVNQKDFYIENFKKFPYICNSCFLIKTETYKKIVNDKSLFVDDFDEVPINLYKQNNNLNFCFVRNGFGLHYLYNSAPNHIVLEKQYHNKLKSYIG